MNITLQENMLPLRLRYDLPMTDEEFLRFCAANEPLRLERDANGDIIVLSPTGTEGRNAELDIATDLNNWARHDRRGRALGPSSGVKLPDSAVLAADAAWVSWERYNAAGEGAFRQFVPEFVIELRSESDQLNDVRAEGPRYRPAYARYQPHTYCSSNSTPYSLSNARYSS